MMDEGKDKTAAAVRETTEQTQAAAENAATAAQHASAAARTTTQAATRTSAAAETSAAAAQTTATAAVITKDSAERADRARRRPHDLRRRADLCGVGADRARGPCGRDRGAGAPRGPVPGWMVMAQASVLIVFAIFCFIAGVRRQLFKVEPDAPDIGRLPGWVLIAVNLFLSLVAASALVGIWVGRQG